MTYDKDKYPDDLLDAVRRAWVSDRRAMVVIDAVREHDHPRGPERRVAEDWPVGTILERDGARWRIYGWRWSENIGREHPQMVAKVELLETPHPDVPADLAGWDGIIPEEDILSGYWAVELP